MLWHVNNGAWGSCRHAGFHLALETFLLLVLFNVSTWKQMSSHPFSARCVPFQQTPRYDPSVQLKPKPLRLPRNSPNFQSWSSDTWSSINSQRQKKRSQVQRDGAKLEKSQTLSCQINRRGGKLNLLSAGIILLASFFSVYLIWSSYQ